MPLMTFEHCWRGRDDCKSFTAIEGLPDGLTEEQQFALDFTPTSFVCCGCIDESARTIPQDAFRLCFKNDETDEMSDNDEQDLTHFVAVATHALAVISTRRVRDGWTQVPTEQGDRNPNTAFELAENDYGRGDSGE